MARAWCQMTHPFLFGSELCHVDHIYVLFSCHFVFGFASIMLSVPSVCVSGCLMFFKLATCLRMEAAFLDIVKAYCNSLIPPCTRNIVCLLEGWHLHSACHYCRISHSWWYLRRGSRCHDCLVEVSWDWPLHQGESTISYSFRSPITCILASNCLPPSTSIYLPSSKLLKSGYNCGILFWRKATIFSLLSIMWASNGIDVRLFLCLMKNASPCFQACCVPNTNTPPLHKQKSVASIHGHCNSSLWSINRATLTFSLLLNSLMTMFTLFP